jgi:hypothetical protein
MSAECHKCGHDLDYHLDCSNCMLRERAERAEAERDEAKEILKMRKGRKIGEKKRRKGAEARAEVAESTLTACEAERDGWKSTAKTERAIKAERDEAIQTCNESHEPRMKELAARATQAEQALERQKQATNMRADALIDAEARAEKAEADLATALRERDNARTERDRTDEKLRAQQKALRDEGLRGQLIAYFMDVGIADYHIANLVEALKVAPDTGDWHGELRGLLHECSRLLPEGSPEYGGTGQHRKPNVPADEQLSRLTTPALSTAREALREARKALADAKVHIALMARSTSDANRQTRARSACASIDDALSAVSEGEG